ncbi:MAG TPA: PDZ domain-containing protein, partial [Alphaproteobacteria bacterium]|nr:PDZ domain-containing protein [Alphaproteobacteria bacterium]
LLESEQTASAPPAEPGESALGLALAPLTPEMREQFGIEEGENGAVIAEVQPGSPAEEAGLQPGDVITRVGQNEVEAPEDVVAAIEEARGSGRNSVLILTERGGQAIFVPLPLG